MVDPIRRFQNGSPVVAPDGNIRIVSSNISAYASLIDLNPKGTVLWKYVFEGDFNHTFWLSDHPVVDNDNTSYLAVEEFVESSYRDSNNSETQVVYGSSCYLCAISSIGELKWKHAFNYLDTSFSASAIAVNKNASMIFVLADYGRLYALNKNGTETWNITFAPSYGFDEIFGIAISPNGTILVSLGSTIWAVNPQGSQLWNRTLMGEIGQGIGFGDRGHVFVYVNRVSSALNPPSALYSFDSNGTQLWKVESGDYSSSPMIVDKAGTVIYSASGIIHAVDKNGSKLWSSDAGEYVVSIGLDSGGRLYILSQNDLAVSNGIPKVTWIDWISRNPLWDLAIVIVSLAVVYVAVIARHWKKNPPNEELHNIR